MSITLLNAPPPLDFQILLRPGLNLWNVNDDHCFSIDATGVWTFFCNSYVAWGVENIIK